MRSRQRARNKAAHNKWSFLSQSREWTHILAADWLFAHQIAPDIVPPPYNVNKHDPWSRRTSLLLPTRGSSEICFPVWISRSGKWYMVCVTDFVSRDLGFDSQVAHIIKNEIFVQSFHRGSVNIPKPIPKSELYSYPKKTAGLKSYKLEAVVYIFFFN